MAWIAIVTDDRSEEELARYTLKDTDIVDCELWARQFCEDCECNLAQLDARVHVPSGSGDFTVTIKDADWSEGHNWDSKSFFYDKE